MRHSTEGTLFLHSPCFDGCVSAAIAWNFLENVKGWTFQHIRLVNYDLANTWLETQLPKRSAVVDFLYHPSAGFWADHHVTSFQTKAMRLDYTRKKSGGMAFYDSTSPSCAMLLWKNLSEKLSDSLRYRDMADWADRIDGARYASVEEAVFGSEPAMMINLSLSAGADGAYCERLLRAMCTKSLDEIAALPEVSSRAKDMRTRIDAGLLLVKNAITLQSDIAVFQVQPGSDVIINRYAPYCFYPEARYSLGLIHSANMVKITAMRNPWRDFESVQLGEIFQKYGGGGHQRVASVVLPSNNTVNAQDVLSNIMEDIRVHELIPA